MSNNEYKFNGKYIIKADLRCLTGLHIGGTEEGFEIGGMDNPVIRDPITGYPYIPGSSLKGKMRSLLEWSYDKVKIETNNKTKKLNAPPCACGSCDICTTIHQFLVFYACFSCRHFRKCFNIKG